MFFRNENVTERLVNDKQGRSRFSFYYNVGTDLFGVNDIREALVKSGLDYKVERRPMFLEDGTLVKDQYCNIKIDDNTQLGAVGNKYTIVQNSDAFNFIDDIVNEGAAFECAGSYKGPKDITDFSKTFVLLKQPDIKILGDEIRPFTLITNSFDGSGGVKAVDIPLRMVCKNGLHREFETAKKLNKIVIKHSSSALERIEAARSVLKHNRAYLMNLKAEAEALAMAKLNKAEYEDEIIPVVLGEMNLDDEDRSRGTDRVEAVRESLMKAYDMEDLNDFRGSAYGASLAVADFDSHNAPFRDTGNSQIYFQRVAGGMIIYNAVVNYLIQKFGIRVR